MGKTEVDLGIDATSGTYTVQLTVPSEKADLLPEEVTSLIADLAAAATLAVSQRTQPITERRPRATRTSLKWKRKATSDYVTTLPDDRPAEVYLDEKGWVAQIGDEVIEGLRSKRVAQEAVAEAMKKESLAH
jgi:hypothetical protein